MVTRVGHVGCAGPDGLRRERGRGVPRPLRSRRTRTCRKRRCRRWTRRSAASSTSSTRSPRSLLEENRDKVEAMTKALLEWETIDAHQIDDIMAGPPAASAEAGARRRTPPTDGGSRGPEPHAGAGGERLSAAARRSDGAGRRPPLFLRRPLVMGIVNVTRRFVLRRRAVPRCRRARSSTACKLRDEGADFVDVGGESTRPGASPVAARRRTAPRDAGGRSARGARASRSPSIRSKPEVMRAAIAAGCAMVNDVNAFRAEGAIEAVAQADGVGLVVMHMQGTPATMQTDPRYDDVVAEVGVIPRRARARASRPRACARAHRARSRLRLRQDRRAQQAALPRAAAARRAGLSGARGPVAQEDAGRLHRARAADERAAASVAAALLAVQNGASLVRVHDVRETVDAINVWTATLDR